MAWLSKKVSDLTGAEGSTEDFIEVTVRSAPGLKEPKKLDVLPSEIKDLKGAGELVILEIGTNGDRKQLIVTLEEWTKLAPNIDDIVARADGIRGRRRNQRPNQGTAEALIDTESTKPGAVPTAAQSILIFL